MFAPPPLSKISGYAPDRSLLFALENICIDICEARM